MTNDELSNSRGMTAWFIANPVAANLLMFFIIVVGLISVVSIKKKMFPDFEVNSIQVVVAYPGASPTDIEQGINIKVEEAVSDVNGIKSVYSFAREGSADITIEVESSYEVSDVLEEVKTAIDGITNWPEDAERPTVNKVEFEINVIWLSLYGDVSQHLLHRQAQKVKDQLLRLPEVSQVTIMGADDLIISIEVSEHTLRRYGFTFAEIADMLRKGSSDIAAGSVKTSTGDIQLRTRGQAYTVQDYENIVLRSESNGGEVKLKNIATVKETFENTDHLSRFNGHKAISLSVQSTDSGSDIASANAVKRWIDENRMMLPKDLHVDYWSDMSFYLKGRMNMMLNNMLSGGLLVFCILALFLRVRLAFWVTVGIPVSFLGALWLMPIGPYAVSINVISLFGFILVLGIVVDDAIVIGESVHTEVCRYGQSDQSVLKGVQLVATPATFGVLTTIAAFAPMLMIGGQGAPFFEAIAMVVILCLFFSLIESKLILPAHLVGMKPQKSIETHKRYGFRKLQNQVNHWLDRVITNYYGPLLKKAVQLRYVTIALFFGILLITIGLLKSGLIHFAFFPKVPMDHVQVTLVMESGAPPSERNRTLKFIDDALQEVNRNYKKQYQNTVGLVSHVLMFTQNDTRAQMLVEMSKAESRYWDGFKIAETWREAVGNLPGVRKLDISASMSAGGGKPLMFRLAGEDYVLVKSAAQELDAYLHNVKGVFNVENSYERGTSEIVLMLKPQARALGLTLNDLGRQVRQGFYGEEIERFQRRDDEIRVLLRYSEQERESIETLEQMRIRTQDGQEIPIEEVAQLKKGKGFASIRRRDGRRSVSVGADVNAEVANPGTIAAEIQQTVIPDILSRYPGVEYGLEGASLEEQESIQRMIYAAVLALFMIYALIAIPLKSYSQPLIIMSIIPFGLIGAVLGHLVFGFTMSMMSLFGLVALAGVLVNDSLVLVDYINATCKQGVEVGQAVMESGVARFRAIALTSITTFLGLLPIMLEKSLQAQIVIPMAVSLAFGILFATFITLFLIPALYMALHDINNLFSFQRNSKTD